MPESINNLFAVLIAVTVFLTAFAIGMETTGAKLRSALGHRSFGLVLGVNVLLAPLLGLLIAGIFPLDVGTETGLLLCSICAAGPVGLKASQISRSDLSWALALTVLLLTLNVVSLPLWSAAALDRSVSLQARDLVAVLIVAIILPVILGSIVARRNEEQARHWVPRVNLTSHTTFALAVLIGVIGNASELLDALSSWAILASVIVVVTCGLLGWAIPADRPRRRASTLVTLNRATSVALLVVGRSFSETPEVFVAVVVFGLVQTVAALGLSIVWGRSEVRSARVAL